MASPELTRRLRRHREMERCLAEIDLLTGSDPSADDLVPDGDPSRWIKARPEWHVEADHDTAAGRRLIETAFDLLRPVGGPFLLAVTGSDVCGAYPLERVDGLDLSIDLRAQGIETVAVAAPGQSSCLVWDLVHEAGRWFSCLDFFGPIAVAAHEVFSDVDGWGDVEQ